MVFCIIINPMSYMDVAETVDSKSSLCVLTLAVTLLIKPTRCTNFTNLFWCETLHVSDELLMMVRGTVQNMQIFMLK